MSLPVVLLLLSSALAQEPTGSEFQVNATLGYNRIYAAAAADAGGNFVVVWMTSVGPFDTDVYGQLFDAAGRRRGAEFLVNTSLAGFQAFPDVYMKPAGDFVVGWMSNPNPYGGGPLRIDGQRYDAAGSPLGGEFVVSPSGGYRSPTISSAADGGFVFAWSGPEVHARRFDAAGTPLGAELQVNTFTTGFQNDPSVGTDATGNFVVVWESYGQDGSALGIFAQRFDASGTRRGSEFRVNTSTAGEQAYAAVAVDEAGGFTVVWQGLDGDREGVHAQRYDPAGMPRGGEFRVNPVTTGSQGWKPAVAAHPDGSFIVSWAEQPNPDTDLFLHIMGQRYDEAGAPLGAAFRADTYVPDGARINPAIALQPAGNFVLAWEGEGQNRPAKDIFARRFVKLVPSAMSVDTSPAPGSNGNRVFEPGEQVAVAPSWRNAAGAPRTFQGEGVAFSGPTDGGPVYGLVDASADYGTLADGSTASCQATGDCFAVSVSSPANRPDVHWDATFDEALRPESLSQLQAWSLHIGRSFSDVPASSAFYRAVETVLHRGVTSGCGGTEYCPGLPATREQMATFLLVAKHGPGYAPPVCLTPHFADVPASSPFCRWIQELERRGITGGCGGGNYCPTAAVTREQMAVFVLRTLDPALDPPACTTPIFNDVPANSPFCRWIEELARRGVVAGCAPNLYCPTAPLTREQMAVFLTGTFGLTLYGP